MKCIYIEPKYYTGNEDCEYDNNVKGPEIQKCLHEVFGCEGETFDLNDGWLCMMPAIWRRRRGFVKYL